jgi:hypothetical protein
MFFGVIALILAVLGVIQLFSGNVAWGIVLIVAACAVGPGGWAIYK